MDPGGIGNIREMKEESDIMKNKAVKPADDDFKFEVGAMYENMKGAYEVVSILKDAMVIRWDDGNEVATSVELQKRIIERMAFEKKLQQQADGKKQEKSRKPKRKTTAAAESKEEDSIDADEDTDLD
ncbi:MAG: hypothetical protein C4519_07080 [Desulfobacteraceae bacterium]|nr:MAG: hypothetical protein C4519_07080 [Desulfobacteraceae bacterium]